MEKKSKIFLLIIFTILVMLTSIFLVVYLSSPKTITGNIIKEIEILQPKSDPLENKFVTKITDGDTVVIDGESVRLLGIDADERGYPCYKQAKKRLEELILNKKVQLEKDTEDKDRYKRYLRYIFLDGKNINLQLVEEGLAVARFFPKNQKYKNEILTAEKKARENKIGCKWEEKKLQETETNTNTETNSETKTNTNTETETKTQSQETNTNTESDLCVDLGCPKGTRYVGSLKSNKYHECSCKWAEKIYEENLNCFKSEAEAKTKGYIACKVCEP